MAAATSSDVFAFGMLLWWLATNGAAVHGLGSTAHQIRAALSNGRRPSLDAVSDDRLHRIIACCWEPIALNRWTWARVGVALRRAQASTIVQVAELHEARSALAAAEAMAADMQKQLDAWREEGKAVKTADTETITALTREVTTLTKRTRALEAELADAKAATSAAQQSIAFANETIQRQAAELVVRSSRDGTSDMAPLPADQTVTPPSMEGVSDMAPLPADHTVTLRIKCTTNGRVLEVRANKTDTVASVKQLLAVRTGGKSDELLLIYCGKEMEDDKKIRDYCAQDMTMAIFLRFLQREA
jgi:hypothetical protein